MGLWTFNTDFVKPGTPSFLELLLSTNVCMCVCVFVYVSAPEAIDN